MKVIASSLALVLFALDPVFAKDVQLSAGQLKNLGIETAAVQAASERPVVALPALVGPARDSRVVVVAPFPGTVTGLMVLEGESVARGARLATVFSRDLLSVQSQLAQLQAELAVATAAADRTRLLASEGIVAGARAQEAEARASALRAQLEEQRQILAVAPADAARAGSYVLTAPAAGRIASIDIEPGARVDAMESTIVIDKSDRLWLEAQLPADLVGQIKPGTVAAVAAARGKVIAAGMTVDPRTRSVILRAEFPASSGLVPGSAVTMTLLVPAPGDTLSVPTAALARVRTEDTLFVETQSGFQSVKVNVLGRNSETAAVTGTLKPGQRVAVAGLSELKVLVEQD
jgi:membrane fusion protein, heavy metal efflux system